MVPQIQPLKKGSTVDFDLKIQDPVDHNAIFSNEALKLKIMFVMPDLILIY
jgi:hypothetical protein